MKPRLYAQAVLENHAGGELLERAPAGAATNNSQHEWSEVQHDLVAAKRSLAGRAAALRGEAAVLQERRVVAQGQILDLLGKEVGRACAPLEAAAGECEAQCRQLEELAGELSFAAARRPGSPACDALTVQAARQLAQLAVQGPAGGAAYASPLLGLACRVSHLEHQVDSLEGAEQPGTLRSLSVGKGVLALPGPSGAACTREMAVGSAGCEVSEGLVPPPPPSSLGRLQALLGLGPTQPPTTQQASPLTVPAPSASGGGSSSSDSSGSAYCASLRSQYHAMLSAIQQQHAVELQALRLRQQEEMAQKEEAHRAALEGLQQLMRTGNPALQAELRLLQEDNAALKAKLSALSAEYDTRVQMAAFNARVEAEAQHQQQLAAVHKQRAGSEGECGLLQERMSQLEAELELQRAERDADAARAAEAQAEAVAAAEKHYRSLLQEREREHAALLEELKALKSCMSSLAPSRSETRAAEYPLPEALGDFGKAGQRADNGGGGRQAGVQWGPRLAQLQREAGQLVEPQE